MSAPSRWAPRVCRFCRASPTPRRTFASASATSTTTTETKPQQWPQRQPRGEYYDILLRDPPPYANNKAEKPPSSAQPAASPPPPSPSSSEAKAATPSGSSPARTYETISSRTAYSDSNTTTAAAADREATAEERARVIFGSRLLGPAERADRAAGRQAKSTTIAGVLVPPRPEEPDNCCMSGPTRPSGVSPRARRPRALLRPRPTRHR
ncbi:hypothetical protein PWT90_02261 [Aphanocladium album]|nr:hypothetical protein PWT90_02261 [Aphanocladium album]